MTSTLHILQHALGRDQYGVPKNKYGTDYRNHFCAGPGHDDFDTCRKAVADGLMVERPPSVLSGGDHIFCVTAKGKDYVTLNSPQPPRLTPGARRYRDYLNAETSETFIEWLQRKGAEAKEARFWRSP